MVQPEKDGVGQDPLRHRPKSIGDIGCLLEKVRHGLLGLCGADLLHCLNVLKTNPIGEALC
jgi:hypothetical protein